MLNYKKHTLIFRWVNKQIFFVYKIENWLSIIFSPVNGYDDFITLHFLREYMYSLIYIICLYLIILLLIDTWRIESRRASHMESYKYRFHLYERFSWGSLSLSLLGDSLECLLLDFYILGSEWTVVSLDLPILLIWFFYASRILPSRNALWIFRFFKDL